METNPPPYSPQAPLTSIPTAPPAGHMLADTSYPFHQMPTTSHDHAYPQSNISPNASTSNGFMPQQNQLYPQLYQQPLPVTMAASPAVSQTSALAQTTPQRCKAGTVEVNKENVTNENNQLVWMTQFVEVSGGVLTTAPSRDKRTQTNIKSLKDCYVSMPAKKQVAIENKSSSMIIKAPTEVRAHQWFMTLSQYCFVAPMMEGYADKLCRRKKLYEERFLRLTSDGILSWYGSDSEDSDRRNSIQVRGEKCEIDSSCSQVVNVLIQPKMYQFRFSTTEQAQQWLVAFNWHSGRKPLKKASVELRNRAKS